MARDMLDAELLTLCEELERAGALLSALPDAWPWFAQCGAPAPELIAGIRGAAARGRAAHTETGAAAYALREAEAVGVELAKEAFATQVKFRTALRSLEFLHTDDVRQHVLQLREQMVQRRPRLQGAVDQWRNLAFALSDPDQAIVRFGYGPEMIAMARGLVERLETGLRTREAARRAHREAERLEGIERLALVDQARRLRRVWDFVNARSEGAVAPLTFEQAAREWAAARRRAARQRAEQAEEEPACVVPEVEPAACDAMDGEA